MKVSIPAWILEIQLALGNAGPGVSAQSGFTFRSIRSGCDHDLDLARQMHLGSHSIRPNLRGSFHQRIRNFSHHPECATLVKPGLFDVRSIGVAHGTLNDDSL